MEQHEKTQAVSHSCTDRPSREKISLEEAQAEEEKEIKKANIIEKELEKERKRKFLQNK